MPTSRAFYIVYLVCGAIPTSVRSFVSSMLQQSVMLGASVSQLLYLSFSRNLACTTIWHVGATRNEGGYKYYATDEESENLLTIVTR